VSHLLSEFRSIYLIC
jgi:hypothetical protein